MVAGKSVVPAHARPHIAALRQLITPGLYAAPLESSPLINLPVVLARSGTNASAGMRAQTFILALEEVVADRLKGPDQLAARILFAMGDWAGRPVQDRHHRVARLRNRNWTWERNYRKEPLSRDLMAVLLALYRLDDVADQGAVSEPVGDRSSFLVELSERLLRRAGRRRTAYPLDMSLEELRNADLFVEARLVRYHKPGIHHESCSIEDLIRALGTGKSVLLLGEPGSGKSVTLYETARRSLPHGLVPLPIRARDHRELLADEVRRGIGSVPSTALFIDALDEAARSAANPSGAVETLESLGELMATRPSLITSRLRDYEDRLSAMLHDQEFDEVYLLSPWTAEAQFREYLGRLTAAGLVDEPDLYETVVSSERLTRLVERPLYARMLTFIGERSAADLTDPVALYGEYLTRLARVAEAANPSASPALPLWQAAAWFVYTSGRRSGDAISMPELRAALSSQDALSSDEEVGLWRMLDQIVDTRHVQGRELGEFLHFSFYEHLVAKQVGDLLTSGVKAADAIEILSHDLTREIRHHLTGRLRLAPTPNLEGALLEIYQQTRRSAALPLRRRLIACNLLIYLLSRLIDDSEEALMALLRDEDDSFLRGAVLWALCHRGSSSALHQFFTAMESDPRLRSECRGYVLYYYGDLREHEGPPYYDDPPYRACINSHQRITAMFGNPAFRRDISAERRFVDLYTFLDLLIVRSHRASNAEIEIITRMIDSLRVNGIAATLLARLEDMINSLAPEDASQPH